MAKARYGLLLAVPVIVWACGWLQVVFGGFSIPDKGKGCIWFVVGVLLVVPYLVACIFRRTRLVAMLSVVFLIVFLLVGVNVRQHRLVVGVRWLEAVYQDIAARGAPFPESIDRADYKHPGYLHWYYQRNSDQSFAIVYIVSSDGYAMEYPRGTWRSVGYRPDGYDPCSLKEQ